MLDQLAHHGLFSVAEVYRLRIEAMHLYEQCLTTGDDGGFVGFVEAQILVEPPRLLLLYGIAEDLEQRLLSLNAHQFDVHERVTRMLRDSYDIEVADWQADDRPGMEDENALDHRETALVNEVIVASDEAAVLLESDIQTTIRLRSLVLDWVEGISAVATRQHWNIQFPTDAPALLH